MLNQNKRAAPAKESARLNNSKHSTTARGIDSLLSQLEKVRRTGNGTWQARCPAHDDNGPSLSIRETDDGKTLIHCFAGCTAHEVVAAVGMEITDLFPPRPTDPRQVGKPERRPFPAADILRAIGFEALVVGCGASSMAVGKQLSDDGRERLLVAVGRIQAALDAGGIHG